MVDASYDYGFDNDITPQDAQNIFTRVMSWHQGGGGGPERFVNRFSYDGRNQTASLAVTVEGAADQAEAKSEINSLLTQLNSNNDARAEEADDFNVDFRSSE